VCAIRAADPHFFSRRDAEQSRVVLAAIPHPSGDKTRTSAERITDQSHFNLPSLEFIGLSVLEKYITALESQIRAAKLKRKQDFGASLSEDTQAAQKMADATTTTPTAREGQRTRTLRRMGSQLLQAPPGVQPAHAQPPRVCIFARLLTDGGAKTTTADTAATNSPFGRSTTLVLNGRAAPQHTAGRQTIRIQAPTEP
jgi:hypothetical protein